MYHVFVLTDREVESSALRGALESESLTFDMGTELGLDTVWNGNLGVKPDAALLDLGLWAVKGHVS